MNCVVFFAFSFCQYWLTRNEPCCVAGESFSLRCEMSCKNWTVNIYWYRYAAQTVGWSLCVILSLFFHFSPFLLLSILLISVRSMVSGLQSCFQLFCLAWCNTTAGQSTIPEWRLNTSLMFTPVFMKWWQDALSFSCFQMFSACNTCLCVTVFILLCLSCWYHYSFFSYEAHFDYNFITNDLIKKSSVYIFWYWPLVSFILNLFLHDLRLDSVWIT